MIDLFRIRYNEVTPEQQELIEDIKTRGRLLFETISKIPAHCDRERNLAIERLEEVVMWAVKGATG